MKKKNFSKVFAAIALAASSLTGYAQQNLGAECGCPTVASRPTVLLSSLAVNGGASDGNIIDSSTVLDCSKKWILDKKIYVGAGKRITINPGTVVMGENLGTGNASALIIQRGAQIIAAGTESCPIVFTSNIDPMDGTFPIANRGQWGGLVILGKATNNLKVGNSLCAGTDGIGFAEGYLSADSRNLYGSVTPNDNDNSGILRYVSVRHAGDILAVGNELNGITLGSVGRGTTIDHIEVVSCDDDAIEIFGGTVNVKYVSLLFGNDDMFDYDQGWTGKAQFVFGLKADATTAPTADNGFEADGDDNKSNALPRSHPKFYNVTMIGNDDVTTNGDNSGICAIKAKEITEGEIYNSVFANWKNGLDLIKSLGTRTGSIESYQNWQTGFANSGSLIINCNTFLNTTNVLTIANATAAILPADNTKFTTDNNTTPASVAGFDNTFAISGTLNTVSNSYNAVPSPALTTSCSAPGDGFFTVANYRGAFAPGVKSWLANWSYFGTYSNVSAATNGLTPCPTDIDGNGTTNNADFLELLGEFNQSCN
jgi:hypothetical protein